MLTLENTIGPFAVFFTNINSQMKLRGHSHYAEVRLTYRGDGTEKPLGFPAFEDTYREVHDRLREVFEGGPLVDHSNEDIARAVFRRFNGWIGPAMFGRGGQYHLVAAELAVRGVLDKIGHADGFTVYRVTDG